MPTQSQRKRKMKMKKKKKEKAARQTTMRTCRGTKAPPKNLALRNSQAEKTMEGTKYETPQLRRRTSRQET
jgi:hypothetical protein